MLFKNVSDKPIRIAIGKGYWLKPGAVVDLEEGVCKPRLWSNGTRRPSIIEDLCPPLEIKGKDENGQPVVLEYKNVIEPEDSEDRSKWLETPVPHDRQVAAIPTVEGLMRQGLPRGMAEAAVKDYLKHELLKLEKSASQREEVAVGLNEEVAKTRVKRNG